MVFGRFYVPKIYYYDKALGCVCVFIYIFKQDLNFLIRVL